MTARFSRRPARAPPPRPYFLPVPTPTPASTSDDNSSRTAGTPSSRNRAFVGPGPTRIVIASAAAR